MAEPEKQQRQLGDQIMCDAYKRVAKGEKIPLDDQVYCVLDANRLEAVAAHKELMDVLEDLRNGGRPRTLKEKARASAPPLIGGGAIGAVIYGLVELFIKMSAVSGG